MIDILIRHHYTIVFWKLLVLNIDTYQPITIVYKVSIMWFLKEFILPLYMLRFFGICLFSLIFPLNNIQSKTHQYVYSVLVSSTVFSVTIFLLHHTYVTELKVDCLKQIYTITSLIFMTSTIMIYSLTIILSTKNRYIISHFLNKINAVFLSINKINKNQKTHNFYLHIIVFVVYVLLNSIVAACFDLNTSIEYLIMDILHCWMEIIVIYFVVVINDQFSILFDNLRHTLQFDLAIAANYGKLSIIFERLEELFEMNFQLEKVFGGQLILNCTYDFVVLTISIYLSIYFARPSNLEQDYTIVAYFYFIFHIVPHGLKVLLISQTMDKLGKQVNTYI